MICLVFLMQRRHIAFWSGGKDSTASIILAHQHGEPLHEIIYVEVMYDLWRNISGENPYTVDFIKNTAELFESWGYPVTVLRSDTDYLSIFHHVIDRPRRHLEHQGMRYGFPIVTLCSVKRDCKLRPIEKYLRSYKGQYISYLGIAADEKKRLASMHRSPDKISLLEKYGYTQEMSYLLCESYGLHNRSYELSSRSGCWMCPMAKEKEHQLIKQSMPDIWDEFVSLESLDDLAFTRWNPFGDTLKERDQKLRETDTKIKMKG